MKSARVAVVVFAVLAWMGPVHTQAHPVASVAVKGGGLPATDAPAVNNTLRALDKLRTYGYRWSTDAGADKAIRSWQKVNGLEVDGIVGPITLASLGLDGPVVASVPAVRQSPPAAPAAPPGDACGEMSAYRQAAGLPDVFDAVGYRESRCRNDVTSSTGCCVGWLQVHTGNFTAPGYRDGIAACGVARRSDIQGDSDAQKRAQMCVARVLYDVSGMSPWSL